MIRCRVWALCGNLGLIDLLDTGTFWVSRCFNVYFLFLGGVVLSVGVIYFVHCKKIKQTGVKW